MKFGKILALLVMIIFFAAGNCCAMQFSQPVKIGDVFGTPQGGFVINGATQNNGELYKAKNGQIIYWKEHDIKTKKIYNVNVHGKGVAQFGNGDDALYFHYDFYQYLIDYGKGYGGNYQEGTKNGAKFGGKNPNNLFSINQQIYETACTFEKISTDKNLTLYMLIYHAQVGGNDYILLGKKSDGTWVKYFDMEDMNIQYFGLTKNDYGTTIVNRVPHYYTNYYCKDDTINVEYESFDRTLRKNVKVGKFRFKWDEKAQWFSVEQIKY